MAHQPKAYKKFVATAATATLVATAIVPVASAATASDFTDVNSNYKDAVTYLVEQGITNGKTATTFGTTENITRGDAAVFIARALKLDVDGAKDQGFTDLNNRVKNAVNAIVEAKIAGGKSDTKFDPDANITRQEMAKMLANAYNLTAKENANFKDVNSNWIGYVSALKEAGITLGKTETTFAPTANLTRGEFALFMYRAEGSPSVGVVALSSVKASSAKTLTVQFNKAVDTTAAKFDVSRGTVKPSVKEVKFSEDKKTATIEFSTAMAAGEYTVSVTGLTEAALTGKVTVAAEKLTTIKFLTDVAVISGNNITTRVVAENQYGEDVSTKLAGANVSVTASKGTTPTVNRDGVVTVNGAAGTFSVGDKVVVTIVDSQTGVSATQTLTVAQAAQVNSIEIGEVKTDDADLAKKPFNLANFSANASKYYIPVVIKDQYGNVLKAADLVGVDVLSSNKSIVNPNKFEDTKNGTVISLQTPTGNATAGTAVITIVSSGTGKTANTTIEVKQNSKLDVVTLEAPATTLKLTKATELPITISNTYGEEVALADVTTSINAGKNEVTLDGDTKITAINATFAVEQDYVNKKAVLKITPTAKNMTLTVVTATGKVQILNLTADEAPVVAGLNGLKSNFVSLLGNDASLTTNLKSAVQFVDQYGSAIAQPDYDASNNVAALDFTIQPKDANNTVTSFNAATGVVTASATAGNEVYEVILKDKDGNVLDQLDVTVSVVDQDKLTAFAIDDLNKFYTGAVSAPHNQQVTIHGLLNDKKVKVTQDLVADVTASNGLPIGTDGAYTASVVDTKNADVASTLTVLVANANNTYTVKKDVTYNSATPRTSAIEVTKGFVDVTADTVQVKYDDLNGPLFTDGEQDGFEVFAYDQYGVQRATSAFTAVVTNNNTGGTITSAGVGSGFTAADAGKSLTLTVRVDGVTKTIRIVVGQ